MIARMRRRANTADGNSATAARMIFQVSPSALRYATVVYLLKPTASMASATVSFPAAYQSWPVVPRASRMTGTASVIAATPSSPSRTMRRGHRAPDMSAAPAPGDARAHGDACRPASCTRERRRPASHASRSVSR